MLICVPLLLTHPVCFSAVHCGIPQNGAGAGDRVGGAPAFPWPKPDRPMMFWAQLGPEEISASGEPPSKQCRAVLCACVCAVLPARAVLCHCFVRALRVLRCALCM